MLSLIKTIILSLGSIYNSSYDNINGTFYPNHTDYIKYIEQNNKSYNYDNYLIFKDNIDYIEDMNSKNLSYNLEINWLIDYKINSRMDINKRTECHNCYSLTDDIIPESIDWREKDVVTHVKNQGNCGSCWSFSSTGAVEGAWAIKNNQLYNLSEQMLMDCSDDYGNKGCQGGLMDNAFKYIIDNGLCSEEEYPYGGDQERCQSSQCNRVVHISDYTDVEQNDEKVLKRAVAQQPISVAIQANLSSLHFYKSGIYQDPECGDGLDHGVLIVGYGHDLFRGLDYWIIKNSWGDTWGEKGYFKMLRNYEGSDSGMCGIALQPSFPII
jgi:C1A family cysteine protease